MKTAEDIERGSAQADADRTNAAQNMASTPRMSVDAANKAEPISLPATCNGERSSENETVRQGMPEEQPRKNESKITDGEIRSS
jgi:hypothetical protein